MAKVDLHTHSMASPDGSLSAADYRRMLESGRLDAVAVTDHNTISFAAKLRQELGSRIIVGEEISTRDGEIIGLYLKKTVKPGMDAADTAAAIKDQGGLVYIPHPLETFRKGLSLPVLDSLADRGRIDIVETRNGRAVFQNRTKQAEAWAIERRLPTAAASDAHGWHGWGRTYTAVEQFPSRANLSGLLANATYAVGRPGLRGILYPKLNRIRRRRRG